nr:Toll/interleukin-1 receptor (TIR) domain-containing protein [Tanacetum cinerariifolium]
TSGLVISSFDVIVLEISIPSPNRQQSLLLSSPQAHPRGTNALVNPPSTTKFSTHVFLTKHLTTPTSVSLVVSAILTFTHHTNELIEAIQDSKFYIIIFSKNYASSSWCLEELVNIMECRKGFGHTAYPVFYDVEPTKVRKQSREVGDAFARHKKELYHINASDMAGFELKSIANG